MKKKEKTRQEMRADLEKEYGPEQADKMEQFLQTMAEIVVDIALEEQRRLDKLKESPGGFNMDKPGYSCTICGRPAAGENSWFDEHGLKCRLCQGGIDRKEVPAWLGEKRDDWYSAIELESYFSLKSVVLRQWIKKGLLANRVIKDDAGRVHLQVFLIEENKEMLPPKDLLKGGTIKETVNGREEFVFAPWYWFADPKEHLKGYRIGEYLKLVPMDGEKHAEK